MPSSSTKAPATNAGGETKRRRGRLIPLRNPRLAPGRADEFEASLHQAVSAAFDELYELDKAIEGCHEMMESIWRGNRGRVGVDWVPERDREGKLAASGTRPVVYCANGSARSIPVGGRIRRSYMVTELPAEDIKLGLAKLGPYLRHQEVRTLRRVLEVLREVIQRRESVRSWLGEILTRANLARRPNGGAALAGRLCARVDRLKPEARVIVNMMPPASPRPKQRRVDPTL